MLGAIDVIDMIDENYLRELANKIYSIDCKGKDCNESKNHLEWCPKGYADEIIKSLSLINKNTSICEHIVSKKCI